MSDPAVSIARPALVVWLAAYAAAAAVRPGALLELALVGLAGALLLSAAGATQLTWSEVAVAALAFSLPLLNTYGARVYDTALERAYPALAAVLAVPTLLALAALTQADRDRCRRAPALLKAAAAAGVLAAITAAAFADDRSAASLDGWWQIGLPVLVGAATLGAVRTPRAGWVVLDAVVLAALVPCLVGIAAYVSSFGVPLTVDSLVIVKRELSRQFLFQEVTFGNVGHLADLTLLVAPLGIVAAVQARTRLLQAASASAALGALCVLVLTVSRSAIAALCLVLMALGVLLWRTSPRASIASLVAAAALVAILVTTVVSTPPQRLTPGPGVAAPAPSDESGSFRRSAATRGLEIAADHLPFGVGAGRYADYDPVHRSAHSLGVEVLAELGILGFAAFLCLIAFAVQSIVAVGIGRLDDRGLLVLGASSGALAFLTHGLVAGAPLALDNVTTWVCLLALYVALIGGQRVG